MSWVLPPVAARGPSRHGPCAAPGRHAFSEREGYRSVVREIVMSVLVRGARRAGTLCITVLAVLLAGCASMTVVELGAVVVGEAGTGRQPGYFQRWVPAAGARPLRCGPGSHGIRGDVGRRQTVGGICLRGLGGDARRLCPHRPGTSTSVARARRHLWCLRRQLHGGVLRAVPRQGFRPVRKGFPLLRHQQLHLGYLPAALALDLVGRPRRGNQRLHGAGL